MRANEVYIRSDRAPVESYFDSHSERHALLSAELASNELRDRTQALFRKWERRHGFQEGAGELLLPAGYRPQIRALAKRLGAAG
jgi:hypothetical protein